MVMRQTFIISTKFKGVVKINSIAVVICNWNKRDFLDRCVSSVINSSFRELDIIVVDNASTDGSANLIRRNYGSKVQVIENLENLGGAGGFNTGIQLALEKGYKYIHLLDNDVVIHPLAIKHLYEYMELHDDVGIAGSLIYSLDQPDCIQEAGARIDFNNFNINLNYSGFINASNIKQEIECDYVPACSMMIRTEALKKAGTMDPNYFIYWDDIDLGYRIKNAGYRIVSYTPSIVWHKKGASTKTNTFSTYYFWRNRIHFFLSYLKNEQLDDFARQIIKEIFQVIYICNYRQQYNIPKTILLALEDALNGVRGKAPEGRIFIREQIRDRFTEFVLGQQRILLVTNCDIRITRSVVEKIGISKIAGIICKEGEDIKKLSRQFPTINIRSVYEKGTLPSIAVYNHVLDADFTNDIDLYVDQYFNVVQSEEDRHYMANYKTMYQIYQNIYFPVLKQRFLDWREKNKIS